MKGRGRSEREGKGDERIRWQLREGMRFLENEAKNYIG